MSISFRFFGAVIEEYQQHPEIKKRNGSVKKTKWVCL